MASSIFSYQTQDPYRQYLKSALFSSAGAGSLIALGAVGPGLAFNNMLTTFGM